MSIFGSIVNATSVPRKPSAAQVAGTVASVTGTKPKPMTREQVEAMIQKNADDTGRSNYNWKHSIVDLMKLLDLDSSLNARKELAQELGYTGALDGSAEMNIWLHEHGDGEADGIGRHGAGRPEIGVTPAFGLSTSDRAARTVRAALLVAVVVAYAARTTLYPSS